MSDDTDAVVRLFAKEVPEIADGTIKIMAIARNPGYRTKLALYSRDPHVDCIGKSVGIRGVRIKKIVDALGRERIDLIRWEDSPEKLIANALQPANINKVLLQPAEHRAVVIVKSDQVPLAIGRGDVNRQLASELSGWHIDIEELKE
jgi:N utilization substance protein A